VAWVYGRSVHGMGRGVYARNGAAGAGVSSGFLRSLQVRVSHAYDPCNVLCSTVNPAFPGALLARARGYSDGMGSGGEDFGGLAHTVVEHDTEGARSRRSPGAQRSHRGGADASGEEYDGRPLGSDDGSSRSGSYQSGSDGDSSSAPESDSDVWSSEEEEGGGRPGAPRWAPVLLHAISCT
jgi:hypothetical protein